MSADNGWLLRKNTAGEYILQIFFMSADNYPPVDEVRAQRFINLEDAMYWYELHAEATEYGLTVKIAPSNTTRDPECVSKWPECFFGGYNPSCCRWPKSCSC